MRFVNIFLSALIVLGMYSCLPPGGHCPGEDDHQTTTNCSVQPDAGPCEAHITKYYYDAQEGKCKEFVWGGCQGTVPFHTLKDCEECSGTGPSESDNHNEGIFGGFN
jgi:hypothetical protein